MNARAFVPAVALLGIVGWVPLLLLCGWVLPAVLATVGILVSVGVADWVMGRPSH